MPRADGPRSVYTPVNPDKCYQVEIFNSELNQRVSGEIAAGKHLEESAVPIEAGRYRLLRFKEESA
ncbi:MAG TPA: hypothetical protein VFU69_17235 [Ktedonobacterales bacterium]|nr:hypothetical protein [Ktedonobacterales bacterium]